MTAGAWAIDVQERDAQNSELIIYGSEPSELPTGGTLHALEPQSINAFDGVDVSAYPWSRPYVGYGVFDKSNQNCVNIDAEPSDTTPIEFNFEEFNIFNGHAYAISQDEMTFPQCQSLTAKYNGYPAMVTTSQENNALAGYYRDSSFWLNTQRSSCNNIYLDARGREQQFQAWPNQGILCDSTKLNVIRSKGIRTWSAASGVETHRCVIEFDTDDVARPIKACAPWWSVERDYPIDDKSKYVIQGFNKQGEREDFDIRSIHQKDSPRNIEVCTKVSSTGITQVATRDVVCNSYYSIKQSPRCAVDIYQEVCHVNECKGTIQNTCKLIDTEPAPLEYAKQVVIDDKGFEKMVKGKDGIKMHKYRCPVYSGDNGCLESKIVSMLPQPCPGTDKDKDGNEIRAIRVYGDPSIPPVYDGGSLVALKGRCPDGTLVDVPVDVMRDGNKQCLEYATTKETKEEEQVCTLKRDYIDHTILTSITEPDAFLNNENCVRLNNVEDARPGQEVFIEYELNGFANLSLVKAQIEGTVVDNSPIQLGSPYINSIVQNGAFKDTDYAGKNAEEIMADYDLSSLNSPDCTPWQDNAFMTYLENLKNIGVLQSIDNTKGELLWLGNIPKQTCDASASAIGATVLYGADDTNATEVSQRDAILEADYIISDAGVNSGQLIESTRGSTFIDGCLLSFQHANISGDDFVRIKYNQTGASAPADLMLTSGSMVDYYQCREYALCLNADVINANKYLGNEICRVQLTETSGKAAADELKQEITTLIESQTPDATSVGKNADETIAMGSDKNQLDLDAIDGIEDIYAFVEYTDPHKGMGYISGYSSRNYKTNRVFVNGKLAHPKNQHQLVQEDIWEDYRYDGHTYKNYSPSKIERVSLGLGAGGGVDVYGGASLAINLVTLGGAFAISYTVAVLTGGGAETFDMSIKSTVYNPIDPAKYRYTENPVAAYETRKRGLSPTNNLDSIIYATFVNSTGGRMPGGMAGTYYRLLKEEKLAAYKELNIVTDNGYQWPTHEAGLPCGYPGVNKWKPWEKKSSSCWSNGWKTLPSPQYHRRKLNSYWLDSTNAVTLLLPYKGDYELEALNKYDDVVSRAKLLSSTFISNGYSLKWSKVDFGAGSLAKSINVQGDGCFMDPMAEVGGGVSGVYYELPYTGYYNPFECGLSDFEYVKDMAITKITVKPTNAAQKFVIALPKPLPYINRVFAANLDALEEKQYRCYEPFSETCEDYSAKEGEE